MTRMATRGAPPAHEERYLQRAQRVSDAHDAEAERKLFQQAGRAATQAGRLTWVLRAVDTVGRAVASASASPCRRGCAHCCHIAVPMTDVEARAIGRSIGRQPAEAPAGAIALSGTYDDPHTLSLLQDQQARASHGVSDSPCPFLGRDFACSIYAIRPIACRLHFSLEDDASHCDAASPRSPVVRLNTVVEHAASIVLLGPRLKVADIRAFFPSRRVKPGMGPLMR
jgi:Fe-S-cluster containining protein